MKISQTHHVVTKGSARGAVRPNPPKTTPKFCDTCGALYGQDVPLESDSRAIEEFKSKDKILRIYQDESAESPREWDNVGKMVCFHKRYNLGDKTNLKFDQFENWSQVKKYLVDEEHAEVIAPLFLYDHSGLRIKIGSFAGLLPQGHAEFDSGMVGYIYVTKEKLASEGITKDKAMKYLEGEVETYDQYLSGDVYGYRLFTANRCKKCGSVSWEETDAVWGFFGSNHKESGLFESAGWKE